MKKLLTVCLFVVISLGLTPNNWGQSLGTAFIYQDKLRGDSSPAEGLFDFEFNFYNDPNINATNYFNSAIGYNALYSNTTGHSNSAMGSYALYSNTIGYYNAAMGSYALRHNTTGIYNSAMGCSALWANTEGQANSAMGYYALRHNTTGHSNSAMGYDALLKNTAGFYNAAIGVSAGYGNSVGSHNTFIGSNAGYNAAGSNNVFLGYKAGYNESGSHRLYIANSEIDPPLIYGEFDTGYIGLGTTSPAYILDVAGDINFTGDLYRNGSVFSPPSPVKWQQGDSDIYYNAGNVGIGTTNPDDELDVEGHIDVSGTYKLGGYSVLSHRGDNIFVGSDAGVSNTSGSSNSAVGDSAMHSNTTGYFNSALGREALYFNTAGYSNSALGDSALYSNTTGYFNSALGDSALYSNATGSFNSAMGAEALYSNNTGKLNSALGYKVLFYNTIGVKNVAMGSYANYYNEQGSCNTIIGDEAGRGTAAHNKSGNVFLGYRAGYYEQGDNKLYIENSDSKTPLIYGEFDNGLLAINGDVGIGTKNPTHLLHVAGVARSAQSTWATSSDRRVKQNINDISRSLEKIQKLRPISYEYTDEYKQDNKALDGTHFGFVAQEVKAVIPEMVTYAPETYGDAAIADFHLLNSGPLIPLLVQAVKELKAENESLIKQLQAENQLLRHRLDALEKNLTANYPRNER